MDSEYLIERDIYNSLSKHQSVKEITIISGARQCGKSTILHKLRTNLEKEGKKTFFLNFDFEKDKTDNFLIEFVNYGGYPRIVTENDINEKTELINEIYNSYIERDLIKLLNINKPELFKDIFRMLSIMSGKLINFSNIADDTNTSIQTLKKYLYFAEKTYSIKSIRPYFNNPSKELRKTPMIYFTDIGLTHIA